MLSATMHGGAMLKIATWNLDRPPANGWKRAPNIKKKLDEIDADVWVLTKTHAAIGPTAGYYSACCAYDSVLTGVDERWVIIWSRWPVEQLATSQANLAVCVRVDHPHKSFLVYGSVFPDGTAKSWQAHYDAIAHQSADWLHVRQQYPNLPLCVAGDFNQNRSGLHWYGTEHGRAQLTAALDQSKLICVTEKLRTIDHICLSDEFAMLAHTIHIWPSRADEGTYLSDHNGLFVVL